MLVVGVVMVGLVVVVEMDVGVVVVGMIGWLVGSLSLAT